MEETAAEDRPSGMVLPLVLRRAHGLLLNEADEDPLQTTSASRASTVVFDTAQAIEEALQNTSRAVCHVQQQIQRGEELYYEETVAFSAGANLFKGWDAYIDARLVEAASETRRLPVDTRWFSTSCPQWTRFMESSPLPCVSLEDVTKVPQQEETTTPEKDVDADSKDAPSHTTDDRLLLPVIKRKTSATNEASSTEKRRTKRKRPKPA
jgi:hypothetical protein